MKWLCVFVLAACGSNAGDDDGPDGAPAGPHTIGEAGGIARLAVNDDCIVLAGGTTVACLPRAGGELRTLATFTDRLVVEPLGDGAGVIATSLPTNFPNDRTLHVDRIAADGTITPLASAFSGFGAGEGLALAGDNVVFTTGGSADLYAVPRAGGTTKFLSSQSGNFGDVLVAGTTAYYVNGFSVYSHDVTGPESHDDAPIGSCSAAELLIAGDGNAVVAAGPTIQDPQMTALALIAPVNKPLPALAGRAGRIVAASGKAYVIAGGDIVSIDLATGATAPEVTGENAFDLVATPDGLVWITMTGAVRTR